MKRRADAKMDLLGNAVHPLSDRCAFEADLLISPPVRAHRDSARGREGGRQSLLGAGAWERERNKLTVKVSQGLIERVRATYQGRGYLYSNLLGSRPLGRESVSPRGPWRCYSAW
jgi:hypothetical protein